MKSKSLVLIAALAIASPLALAQGARGGGAQGKGQGRPPQAQGQQQGQPGQMGRGDMDRDMVRERLRIHATDQQRQQYRTCDQSMNRTRQQAGALYKGAKDKNTPVASLRQQRDQFREQLRLMEQEHHRFMEGLNSEQSAAVQARHQNMEQVHNRIQQSLTQLDEELAKPDPDRKRISEQTAALEREMKQLQKQHEEMGEELSLKS